MQSARRNRRWTVRILLGLGALAVLLVGAIAALAFFSTTTPAEPYGFSAAAVDHITIAPTSSAITAGGSQSYSVTAFDASNNSFGDVTSSTTFSIGPDGSCTANSCTATVSGAHTVTATFWGLTTTAALTVNPSSATHLAFTQSPGTAAAGAQFAANPQVAVEDQFNNVVTTSSASISLAINTQPASGAVLSCTSNPVSAVSGVATFSGCSITGTAGAYTLAATSSPLTAATSAPFSITAVLSVAPASGTVGTTGVTLTGNGYTGGKSITSVTFAGAALTVTPATPTVAANGSWTASFTVPAASNGAQNVAATDNATAPVSASTTFNVSAALTVAPTSGTVGTTGVTLTGTGYTANKTITTVTFGGSTLTVSPATPTVAANGGWTATFTVPASTNGARTIVASDNATSPASASTTYTVNAALSVSPTSGKIGTSGVTLTGTGYTAGKSITSVTFGGSALTVTPAAPTVAATGGWTATFTVPTVPTGTQTITATDNAAAPVSASTSFTVTGVSESLIGHVVTTGSSVTVPSVITTTGATDLILVYRQSGSAGDAINSISGPFTGTPSQITSRVDFASKTSLFAWRASGSGATATVTLTFAKANDVTVVDIVELAGNNTTTPIAQSNTGTGSGSTATASFSAAPAVGDGEVALFASSTDISLTTPTGFTQIDDNANTTPTPGYDFESTFAANARTSATSTLGSSGTWATIALDIAHG